MRLREHSYVSLSSLVTLLLVTKKSLFKGTIPIVAFLLILDSCGETRSSMQSNPGTTTSPPVQITGNPVLDFKVLAESLRATDRSYLSVDDSGIYGLIVAERFHLVHYSKIGWVDSTETAVDVNNEGQVIGGLKVDRPMSVTTRDYTGDRENDFLIRFSSGPNVFGSVVSLRNGVFEFKEFCLLHESPALPGRLRTLVLQDLEFRDEMQTLLGVSVDGLGNAIVTDWAWSSKSECFKSSPGS